MFDLALMKPLMIFGAVKLWKGQWSGLVISIILFSWLVLTSISIISMEFGLKLAGLDFDMGKMILLGFKGILSFTAICIVLKNAEMN